MRLFSTLLLALLITSAPAMAFAEDPMATKIHTLGFPLSVGGKDLDEVLRHIAEALRKLDPATASSLETLAGCATLECILEDPRARDLLERSLSDSGIDLERLRGASVEELIDMIEDPELKQAISALVGSEELSREDAQSILQAIAESYREGSLSARGYMAALEAVRRIAERGNFNLSRSLSAEQLEAIKRALLQSDLMREVAMKLSELGSREGSAFQTDPSRSSLPSLPISLAPLVLALLIFAAVPAIYLVTKSLKVERRLRLIMTSLPHPSWPRAEGALGLYWEAVRVAEAVSGKKREDSVTHREYLEQLRGSSVEEPFSEVTMGYEMVKYAGKREEDFVIVMRDGLERMKRAV